MKRIGLLLFLATVLLAGCGVESAYVEVDSIDMHVSTDYVSGYQLVNWTWVYYEDVYNDYDFDITVTNRGDFRAYDVVVDLHLYLSDGRKVLHSHHIGSLDAYEPYDVHHVELLVNAKVDDYFVETFWSE